MDGSPAAIEWARRKAADRGLDIDLRVGDATELDRIGVTFDTVVDSGLFHCLPPGVQERYVAALRQICAPDAGVAVLCFAEVPGARTPDDKRLTETRLRELFADAWRIESLEPAHLYGLIRDGYGAVSNWPRGERGRTAMTGRLLRGRAATERPAGLSRRDWAEEKALRTAGARVIVMPCRINSPSPVPAPSKAAAPS